MKVKELIEELSKMPQDSDVYFDARVQTEDIDFDDWLEFEGVESKEKTFTYRTGKKETEIVVEVKLRY